MPQGMKFARGVVFGLAIAFAAQVYAQTGSAVVTVQRKAGNADPILQDNVLVFENGKRAPITLWAPLTGEHAGMQLLLLIDDSSAGGLANQIEDIRTFVLALPSAVQVAVGYMSNGQTVMAQPFTRDHGLAAKALRLPQSIRGGGSPYFTLSSISQQWPAETATARREILMITDGIDRYGDTAFNADNPYVTKAIADAQRAQILVYTLYYRGTGALSYDQVASNGGQNYLVQVAQETGGKCLYSGTGNPVSVVPFLNDLSQIMNNQYALRFKSVAKPSKGLVQMKLKMETPGVKLIAPQMVPVIP